VSAPPGSCRRTPTCHPPPFADSPSLMGSSSTRKTSSVDPARARAYQEQPPDARAGGYCAQPQPAGHPFPGMRIVTRARAAASAGAGGSGCASSHGSDGLSAGQGDLVRSQVPDHVLRAGRGPGVDSAAGPAPSARLGGPGPRPATGIDRAAARGHSLPARRRSPPGPGQAVRRWCARGGTGKPVCRWTSPIPSAARTPLQADSPASRWRRFCGTARSPQGAVPRGALIRWPRPSSG
jgi:hypothetical protein